MMMVKDNGVANIIKKELVKYLNISRTYLKIKLLYTKVLFLTIFFTL